MAHYIPKYFTTKLNDNNWSIYIGGEKYFPAYPDVVQEPHDKKIVKRYLVRDTTKYDVDIDDKDDFYGHHNKYPLTSKEAFINENDETVEYEGNTYYVWRAYSEHYNDTIPNTPPDEGQIGILTTTLDIKLPFSTESPEFAYELIGDEVVEYGWNSTYSNYIGLVYEYNDGTRSYSMCDCKIRMYTSYEATKNAGIEDYYQYTGEKTVYDEQLCYIWYRYDSNYTVEEYNRDPWMSHEQFISIYGDVNKAILTNTLWITHFPLEKDSPEYVATIDFRDELYITTDNSIVARTQLPGVLDHIEYYPDTLYDDTITGMTEEIVQGENLNVRTLLGDDGTSSWYSLMDYHGETTVYNGQLCYVWDCPLVGNAYDAEGSIKILTNTLDIKYPFIVKDTSNKPLGFNESPEYVAYVDSYDSYPHFNKAGGWIRYLYEREISKPLGEPIYKGGVLIKLPNQQ